MRLERVLESLRGWRGGSRGTGRTSTARSRSCGGGCSAVLPSSGRVWPPELRSSSRELAAFFRPRVLRRIVSSLRPTFRRLRSRRAGPPAVFGALGVHVTFDHVLGLVEDGLGDVLVPRRQHRQVAGVGVAELVAVVAGDGSVVAEHLDDADGLGLADQRVVAVEVLAGGVAAGVVGAAVAVDGGDDQDGGVG